MKKKQARPKPRVGLKPTVAFAMLNDLDDDDKNPLFMDSYNGRDYWARIFRTKKQAKRKAKKQRK